MKYLGFIFIVCKFIWYLFFLVIISMLWLFDMSKDREFGGIIKGENRSLLLRYMLVFF